MCFGHRLVLSRNQAFQLTQPVHLTYRNRSQIGRHHVSILLETLSLLDNWTTTLVRTRLVSSPILQYRGTKAEFAFLALATLKMKTAVTGGNERIFYSRQFVRHPPDDTWGLPSGIDHGKTCS